MRIEKTTIVAIALFLTSLPLCVDAQDAFVIEPKQPPVIVMSSGSQGAAKVLQEYIWKVTGLELAVIPEKHTDAAKAGAIHVGLTRQTPAEIVADLKKSDRDAFAIHVTKERVFLVGLDGYARQFAVTEFLERYCGVRWYLPGDLGTVVPKLKRIEATAGTVKVTPAYKSRLFSGFGPGNAVENHKWRRMNKQRARYAFHHAYWRMFPQSKYAKSDPEIYCFIDGERKIPKRDGLVSGVQVCLTHPKTVRHAIEIVRKRKFASLSPNDGHGFCQCGECLKWYDPKGITDENPDEHKVLTRYVFQFVNKVARACPDTTIGILAYSNYREAVPGLNMAPNVVVYVVGSRDGSIVPMTRKYHLDTVASWVKAGAKRLGIYEWYHGGGYLVPRIYNHQITDFLKTAHELGAEALYAEQYPNWALDGPKYWLMTRLEWNPGLDVEATLDEFYKKFFAEASAPMKAYFEKAERVWLGGVVSNESGGLFDAAQLIPYTSRALKQLDAHLKEAEKLARQPLVKQRIQFIRDGFTFYSSMAVQYHRATAA